MVAASIESNTSIEVAFCRTLEDGTLDARFGGGCVVEPWFADPFPRMATDGTNVYVPTGSRLRDPVDGTALFALAPDGKLDPDFGFNGAFPVAPEGAPNVATIENVSILADKSLVVSGRADNATWIKRIANGSIEGDIVEPGLNFKTHLVAGIENNVVLLLDRQALSEECPEQACNTGEVCRFGECTRPPPDCSMGCPSGRCNDELNECFPVHAGVGVDVKVLSNTLSTVAESRISGITGTAIFSLGNGEALVYDAASDEAWKLAADGNRVPLFTTEASRLHDRVIVAAALRPDGGIVAAAHVGGTTPQDIQFEGFGVLELAPTGATVTTLEVPGVKISAIHPVSNTQLITGGFRNHHIVIQRFNRVEPN